MPTRRSILTLLAASAWCSFHPASALLATAPRAGRHERPLGDDPSADKPERPFDKARAGERAAITRLLGNPDWPARSIAAMRLERYDCRESFALLDTLARDGAWQVRVFALRVLARRREEQGDWLAQESEPRVVRAAVRHRYGYDQQRLATGAKRLLSAGDARDRMLGVELAAHVEDAALYREAQETLRRIVLRMRREEVGLLAPRLSPLTGQPEWKTQYRWQRWVPPAARTIDLHKVYGLPEPGLPIPASRLASIDDEEFIKLEGYITSQGDRHVDLVVCLDCTASMGGVLAEAQGGIDDLMLFVGDVCASLRIGLVAYRDHRDRSFETRAMPLTSNLDAARRFLWSLSASGGGDGPESVAAAMRQAFAGMDWNMESDRVVIVVGDGQPHVGTGTTCVSLATRGQQHGWKTHTIQAEGKEVKFFPEIAQAGGGQCVSLASNRSVIAEITGLTIGDQFAPEMDEFFSTYLLLCR